MIVDYTGHSGFLVQSDSWALLFDYYQGHIPEIPKDRELFVFVSHVHADHYNPDIFRLAGKRQKIRYILSSDICGQSELDLKKNIMCKNLQKKILYVQPETSYRIPGLGIVRTLRSTDEGVAFLVETDEAVLFHAGDLNWWNWDGEDPKWLSDMETDFKGEVEEIGGEAIDLAFLPLDGRLEKNFWQGFDWFLRSCRIRYAFPMHFWQYTDVAARFEKLSCRKDYPDTIILDTAKGSHWELNL